MWFTWQDGQWCRYRSPWQWYLLCVALGSCAVVALWLYRSCETESYGRFSGLVETVVVELGGFVHSHSEIFFVEGPCEFLVFSLLPSLGLVSGINTVTPGMTFVTVSHGCWLTFGLCVHFVSAFLLVAKFPSSGGFWGDRNSGGRLFVDVPMPYGWRRWLWCGV